MVPGEQIWQTVAPGALVYYMAPEQYQHEQSSA